MSNENFNIHSSLEEYMNMEPSLTELEDDFQEENGYRPDKKNKQTSKISDNSVQHDIKDENILEKAHDLDRSRLLLKYFKRIEKKIKQDIKQELSGEHGGEIGFSKQLGLFKYSLGEQKRVSSSKARTLCYELGMNPELFKQQREFDTIGASHDDGRLTYVRYSQMINHTKNKNEEFNNVIDSIYKTENKENALFIAWSFRKELEDTYKQSSKVLKEDIVNYMDNDGFNPQTDSFSLLMNNNMAFSHKNMSFFSPKSFTDRIQSVYNIDDHPERARIIEVAEDRAVRDTMKASFSWLIKNHIGDLDSSLIKEGNKIINSETPDAIYEHVLENVKDEKIKNEYIKFVEGGMEKVNNMENHVDYLINDIYEVSLIEKFDPPRGKNTLNAIKSKEFKEMAKNVLYSLEDQLSSADIDDMDYLYSRLEASERAEIRFDSRAHIYKEHIDDLDGPRKMTEKLPSLDMGF